MKCGSKTSGGIRLSVHLSHRDIAELAGTGREVVSRILTRFQRLNCIAYDNRRIVVTNADKLTGWISAHQA